MILKFTLKSSECRRKDHSLNVSINKQLFEGNWNQCKQIKIEVPKIMYSNKKSFMKPKIGSNCGSRLGLANIHYKNIKKN